MSKPYTERKMNNLIKAHIREVVTHVPKKECATQILTHYDSFDCVECRMWEVCCRFMYHSHRGIVK